MYMSDCANIIDSILRLLASECDGCGEWRPPLLTEKWVTESYKFSPLEATPHSVSYKRPVLLAALPCPLPSDQLNGHRYKYLCEQPFSLGSKCRFECDAGHQLPPGGVAVVECVVLISTDDRAELITWNDTASPCLGESTPRRRVSVSRHRVAVSRWVDTASPCLGESTPRRRVSVSRHRVAVSRWVDTASPCLGESTPRRRVSVSRHRVAVSRWVDTASPCLGESTLRRRVSVSRHRVAVSRWVDTASPCFGESTCYLLLLMNYCIYAFIISYKYL